TPAVLVKQLKERPQRPSMKNPAVPPALEAIALRCLEKDPEARFQTADDFGKALDEAAASLTGAAGMATVPMATIPMARPAAAPQPARPAAEPAPRPPGGAVRGRAHAPPGGSARPPAATSAGDEPDDRGAAGAARRRRGTQQVVVVDPAADGRGRPAARARRR